MKGGQSAARQHRRAMKKAGVAVAVREVVSDGHPVTLTGRISMAVVRALVLLHEEGADMSSRIAITIGDDHPNFPGRTVVEAKAAASVERPTSTQVASRLLAATDPDRDDAGS